MLPPNISISAGNPPASFGNDEKQMGEGL